MMETNLNIKLSDIENIGHTVRRSINDPILGTRFICYRGTAKLEVILLRNILELIGCRILETYDTEGGDVGYYTDLHWDKFNEIVRN